MIRIVLLLILSLLQAPYATAGVSFCSGTAVIHSSVFIDGSTSGVRPYVGAIQSPYSCTCTIEPTGPPITLNKTKVNLYVNSTVRDCGRRVDIRSPFTKDAIHSFSCVEKATIIYGNFIDGKILVTLSVGNSSWLPDVGQYQLVVEPDTSLSMRTSCGIPVISISPTSVLSTSSAVSSSTQTATPPTTNSTLPARGLAPKHDSNTIVIAVVVVGLGLLAVVFIIIMVLCKGRREERKAMQLSTTQQPATMYQRIYRRASRLYGYIKNARPLPPIPAGRGSIQKYDLGTMEAGHYASIKFTRTNTALAQSKVPVSASSSVSSTNVYIHPIGSVHRQDNASSSNGELASSIAHNSKSNNGKDKHGANKNNDSTGNILNKASIPGQNVFKNTLSDSTYMPMNQSAVEYQNSPTVASIEKHNGNTSKATRDDTENAYIQMDHSMQDEYITPTVVNTEVDHTDDAQTPTNVPVHSYENTSFSNKESKDTGSQSSTEDKEDYIHMADFIPPKVVHKKKVQTNGNLHQTEPPVEHDRGTAIATDGTVDRDEQPDSKSDCINEHKTGDSTPGVKRPIIAQDSSGYAKMDEIVDPSKSATANDNNSARHSSESPSPDDTFSNLFVFKKLSNDTTNVQRNLQTVSAPTHEPDKAIDNAGAKIKPKPKPKRFIKQAPTVTQDQLESQK